MQLSETTKNIVGGLPAYKQAEARQMLSELKLEEIFKDFDAGTIGREAALMLTGLLRQHVGPFFRDKFGAIAGIAFNAMLDEIEQRVNATAT